MTLSIIIVSYNARVDLEQCLSSLRTAPPSTDHETIVVDNGSTDGSGETARTAGVQVIDAGRNVGFAAGNNLAIRASSGHLLLLLNPDTIVPPGAVDRLVEILLADDRVSVVGPRLVDGDGRAELSFGPMLGPIASLRQRRLVRGQARRVPSASAQVEAMTRARQWPDWVSGACLLVRRPDAFAVGLLDERYFMYLEDVDFCAAIRGRGGRILFAPEVEIVHRRGRSFSDAPRSPRALYRQSQLAFYRKHHPYLSRFLEPFLRLRTPGR